MIILDFEKENVTRPAEKSWKNRIAPLWISVNKILDDYPETVKLRSPKTGHIMTFHVDKSATYEFAEMCEGWDGEEYHTLYRPEGNFDCVLNVWWTPYCYERSLLL